MKKFIVFCFAFLFAVIAIAQQKPICLIVRGDDMGSSHAANVKTYKNGIETSNAPVRVSTKRNK
jgi:hypothetical protein